MKLNGPLTPTLSPSDGERGRLWLDQYQSRFGDPRRGAWAFSLSPSDGERVGVRGLLNCIDTAIASQRCKVEPLQIFLAHRHRVGFVTGILEGLFDQRVDVSL